MKFFYNLGAGIINIVFLEKIAEMHDRLLIHLQVCNVQVVFVCTPLMVWFGSNKGTCFLTSDVDALMYVVMI